jgi:hypothetical protein
MGLVLRIGDGNNYLPATGDLLIKAGLERNASGHQLEISVSFDGQAADPA